MIPVREAYCRTPRLSLTLSLWERARVRALTRLAEVQDELKEPPEDRKRK